MKKYRISIVGSGNVAWQLSHGLQAAGMDIVEIVSRSKENADVLAFSLKCRSSSLSEGFTAPADAYFICVKDDAIDEIQYLFAHISGVVAHVSGTKPLSSISSFAKATGVFYPLQTFSKFRPAQWSEIPVFIEASSKEASDHLINLAGSLTTKVFELNSEQRSRLHLSAVFVSNFANYLFGAAEEIVKENRMDFDLLKPLIRETVAKLEAAHPSELQTGPAVRNDREVINTHLKILETHPDLHDIYLTLSNAILKKYGHLPVIPNNDHAGK